MELVSKEMPIGDVMQRYPASVDLMIKYGMKFGCSVNTRESVYESARSNGSFRFEYRMAGFDGADRAQRYFLDVAFTFRSD